MFVTFEGLDSSGKTTQAERLVRVLPALTGREVRFLREPGGTEISERIRALVLDGRAAGMEPLAELFLFSAARAQLVAEVIRPALARGEIVVCDRFFDSTTAYQGFGRGLDVATIQSLNRFATGGLAPDLTVLVEIGLDEVVRRKAAAGTPFDRMESAGRAFYVRVGEGYRELARREPDRFAVVDGGAPVDTVEQQIRRTVLRRLEGAASAR